MIETLRADLRCHHGAPDKTPARRLATLEAAGRLAIPFTTGILVGIGEDRSDRIVALEAIAGAHERHGHVQEVIVQNFLPKPGTAMQAWPPCPPDVLLDAIALARDILPATVHVQAPPNLSDDLVAAPRRRHRRLRGISPVTIDHVNPERAWPEVERLRAVCHGHGDTLVPGSPSTRSSRSTRRAGSTRPCGSRCLTGRTPRAWPVTTPERCCRNAPRRSPSPGRSRGGRRRPALDHLVLRRVDRPAAAAARHPEDGRTRR